MIYIQMRCKKESSEGFFYLVEKILAESYLTTLTRFHPLPFVVQGKFFLEGVAPARGYFILYNSNIFCLSKRK